MWFHIGGKICHAESLALEDADFGFKEDMQAKIMQFIAEWNRHDYPFNWSTKSVTKVMAEAPMKKAA